VIVNSIGGVIFNPATGRVVDGVTVRDPVALPETEAEHISGDTLIRGSSMTVAAFS
jgi:hypothetical protein